MARIVKLAFESWSLNGNAPLLDGSGLLVLGQPCWKDLTMVFKLPMFLFSHLLSLRLEFLSKFLFGFC